MADVDPAAIWDAVAPLARELVSAWGAWAPTLTQDGRCVAFVSDRNGTPQLWVQDAVLHAEAQCLVLSDDPVVSVHWSPDGGWLACAVATGGGVRTEVWVVRPDGRDARRVAGGDQHAVLGPWARQGHELVVTICSDEPAVPNRCVLIDPDTDERELIAEGWLINVLDLTADGRFALLRDGTRGAQFCRLVDREADEDHPVLPYPQTGSTDTGLLRPAPPGWKEYARVAYLVTDAGRPRRELLAIGFDGDGERVAAGALAARADAELEFADADTSGRWLVLVWNVDGRSEVQLVETATGNRYVCVGLPGEVVAGAAIARDGSCVVLSVESPVAPRRLWRLDVRDRTWTPLTPESLAPRGDLGYPELVRFEAQDGLPLSGWLYRARVAPGSTAAPPAMLSLHGGPEAQERPVFNPQHQVLAAAGITVFAPNIRGSSGYGHVFVHADDRWGRLDAIGDVAQSAWLLEARGWADGARIAVTGRSYGGYATLMALVAHGSSFAAGVDICGMSDLLTFYRDTEPWIAAAAVTKYGDPARDGAMLSELSPLHRADAITVPLLVVHGELDTNVPKGEALQIVARLRELGRPVSYLELMGEGHEYRRVDSRLTLLHALTVFLAGALGGALPGDLTGDLTGGGVSVPRSVAPAR
jgi:dipeptidyl aminopeptidase/acylaminoacyl peptidase